MQSALVAGVQLASTPPQHTPSRPRRTISGGSNVVAFRTSGPSDGEPGAFGSFPRGAPNSSSVAESGSWRSSIPARSKPTLLPSTSIPKSESFVKVEGFDAPEVAAAYHLRQQQQQQLSSPPPSPKALRTASLLSRQLSEDNLGTLHRPMASPALASLAKRLEAQVLADPAVKPPLPATAASSLLPPISDGGSDAHESLLRQLQSQFEVFSEALVVRAFHLARRAHDGRPTAPHDAETAFARCTGAASIIAELGADEVAVAGALLHDVLDGAAITEDQLRAMLGDEDAFETVKRVSHIEYACHKYRTASNSLAIGGGGGAETGSQTGGAAAHLVSMLVAQGPPRALLVRLAVALQDARALDSRPAISPASWAAPEAVRGRAARRQAAAAEAIELWSPLANRLGVWSVKAELEDRAFRALHAAEYAELRDRLERVQEPTRLVSMVDGLRSALQAAGVEYLDLSGRPKHLWGVWRKMQAKGYSTERVRDVCGLRIIVKSREDCYKALRAVETAWALAAPPKNYIKCPKANGYQSLHAVADPGDGHLVEIQIRTDKMHYLAEYGAEAGHWKYKEAAAAVASPEGEPSSGDAAGAAREANWAKFVTSQQVAKDKKTRPSGSPSGDNSLSSILASIGEESALSSCDDPQQYGSSPGGANRRTFQQYIAASGQRPAPLPESERRSLVAVVAGGAFSVAELHAGTTLGALLRCCGAELAPRQLHVVLNRKVERDTAAVLHAGDVVELYTSEKPVAPRTAPKQESPFLGNALPVGGLAKKLTAVEQTSQS